MATHGADRPLAVWLTGAMLLGFVVLAVFLFVRARDVGAAMTELHARTLALEDRPNAPGFDPRFESLERRLTAAEKAHEGLASVGELPGRLDELEKRLQKAADAKASLTDVRAEVATALDGVEGRINGRLDALDSKMKSLPSATPDIRAVVDQALFDVLPVGTILPWNEPYYRSRTRKNGPPPGWVYCDGSGESWDLRGRFLRGVRPGESPGANEDEAHVSRRGHHHHVGFKRDPRKTPTEMFEQLRRERKILIPIMATDEFSARPDEAMAVLGPAADDEPSQPHEPLHVAVQFIMKVGTN